jgi:hypothetical protein
VFLAELATSYVSLSAQIGRNTILRMKPHEIKNDFLRHFLATLAYRGRKAIVGAPAGFGTFDAGHGVRTPVEIVSHMSDVLTHVHFFFAPSETRKPQIGSWEHEVERFFQVLSALDRSLELRAELKGRSQEQLLQGPLADAMTHVGQLGMLRRLASSPIPKESFDEAPIRIGDVSLRRAEG